MDNLKRDKMETEYSNISSFKKPLSLRRGWGGAKWSFVLFLFPLLTMAIVAPSQLRVELLLNPSQTFIEDKNPEFSWVLDGTLKRQEGYRILVASSFELLKDGKADLWDSGRVPSDSSANVEYHGKPFEAGIDYLWTVKVWGPGNEASEYAKPQLFKTGSLIDAYKTSAYHPDWSEIDAVRFSSTSKGNYFYDYGKAAFATLRLSLKQYPVNDTIVVALGERSGGGDSISSNPGGTIRYREIKVAVKKGNNELTLKIPSDHRNTHGDAVLLPSGYAEVIPFRYALIKKCKIKLTKPDVEMRMLHYPFNDKASDFSTNDTILQKVWNMSKHTVKATSFLGYYVDGDRERIPYEADAYINQLSHYAVDAEYSIARRTHEYLIVKPTWPTEWILQSVLMAWADYQYTGNKESLKYFYKDLQSKTLLSLEREDGLISTIVPNADSTKIYASIYLNRKPKDIVDWPPAQKDSWMKMARAEGERDGYDFKDYNNVVNAFHYRNLVLISQIAIALGNTEDAKFYTTKAEQVKKAFYAAFFYKNGGIFVDGIGTIHSSVHANLFPLAFGLVPEENKDAVINFIKTRGMACSVYPAQFLMEGLLSNEAEKYAYQLLTATDDRSWYNMIRAGSTMAMEAWDDKHKPNQDWNHAWGTAPANIVPFYLFGIKPAEPGFSKITIAPKLEFLKNASYTLPTLHGKIKITIKDADMEIELPGNTEAKLILPNHKFVILNKRETVLDNHNLTLYPGKNSIHLD
jgi:alpha-L-rhamnosidase